jgi:glycosyltransferase involved in cell wall biosynthesis
MHTPLVSFCVTAYNTEQYIAECLDSILNQQGNYDFEVIIVDDASTDDTEQAVAEYRDSRIRYIRHTSNQGAFVTVNRGFEEARGKFIARIDSDDRYASNFLMSAVPILQQHSEVGLVYGDIAMMNQSGRITSTRGNIQRGDRPIKGNELIPLLIKNYIPAPTILAKREAWADALPVPQGYNFCDWYLSLGIAKKWEFFYLDKVLADYRIHPQNMHRTMIHDKMGERITFQVLDEILNDPELIEKTQAFRVEIYSMHYLTLADKYFGCQIYDDARRCYIWAIRYQPQLLFNRAVMRHLLGTLLGSQIYETSKAIVKPLFSLTT